MKKILIAGDSFGFGQGCSDRLFYIDKKTKKYVGDRNLSYKGSSQYCWASLLQQDYPNYQVINLSKPGLDNMSISMNLFKHLTENVELVIFAGTSANRIQIADPFYPNTLKSWIVGAEPAVGDDYPEEWITATRYYTKHLYNEMAVANMTVAAIASIYGLSISTNSKFLYSVRNVIKPERTSKWLSQLDKYIIKDIYDFVCGPVTGNDNYLAEDGHANDLGHSDYYKQIVKPAIESINL